MWVHFATAGGVRAKSLPDLTPSSYECRDSGWEALCGYFSTLTFCITGIYTNQLLKSMQSIRDWPWLVMLKCLPETDRHGPWIVDTILSPYHPHTIPMLKFHSLVYRQLQAGFKPPGLRESKLHHYHCFTRWFSMIFRLASAWFYKFCQCFAIYRSICAIWCFAVFCPPQSPVGFHSGEGHRWYGRPVRANGAIGT